MMRSAVPRHYGLALLVARDLSLTVVQLGGLFTGSAIAHSWPGAVSRRRG
jgi:hypothetical protein